MNKKLQLIHFGEDEKDNLNIVKRNIKKSRKSLEMIGKWSKT